ncbi:hypothetical protein [Cellvibrio mixtus]|uniref:hypothetical protein n=1 Tax=Cellvibrio mixtus TaxID=39650 RepID=UPI0005868D27|nr:hypothetical protein [Cellvibrio mixtus]
MFNKVTAILFLSSVLVACGGGGGGGDKPPITNTTSSPASSSISSSSLSTSSSSSSSSAAAKVLQGQFKDTSISGVHFVSGGQSGNTNSTGTFSYEEGKNITFSIGGITLGTTLGKALITPIHLIENGSTDSVAVQNMVRFLLMLDADGYAGNGLQISSAVQAASANWTQIDFTAADFAQNLATILSAASAADGGAHQLPTADLAKKHIEGTHSCNYSGVFNGDIAGDNKGKIALITNPVTGDVSGFSQLENGGALVELSGVKALAYNQAASFETGSNGDKSSYAGSFTTVSAINGTWKKENTSGTFSASRVGGSTTALYQFSASFNGSESGLVALNIDATNKVTGSIYNFTTNETQSLSGNVKGPNLNVTAGNNKLQGLLNVEVGTLTGTWSDSVKGTSGTFTGGGCQLNPAPLTINGFHSWKIGGDSASKQLIPASGTDPLVVLDGNPVARVRMTVSPWGEMSFPIAGFDQTGEAETINLSGSSFIEITYKSNQSVNLQLRQYAIHGGTHNQITLPAASAFTTVKVPFADFKGGLTPLDLTKVAKFNFALLSNNPTDGYAELIVKNFKIDKFN